MKTRALTAADAPAAIGLYRDLVGDQPVADTSSFAALVDHPGTSVIGCFDTDTLVAMLTLHVLPNMTQGGRPYALIENVVTARAHRGAGHGRAILQAATDHAKAANCYKIMLLTMRDAGARGFYESCGFSADDKWGMQLRFAPPRTV